ncbi:hypothetical protein [Streptomyces afghaniensis]|uniref:hypothetical protein n=1 Tax=Streptomyces afghaniensis TaxID=66865 RepID=UPI00277F48FF|nr:hypothetical protein [Streptomyces afghaniensis]MDQ1018488.1 hypothetical protein [Streptomyces afghaniensis]
MIESGSSERLRDFSPVQYIAPYLLLITGDAGVQKAPATERPALFWVFTSIAALGAALTVLRLRRMWNTHRRRRALPAWTRFLGVLLALYGLYVAYCVADGISG